MPLLTKQYKFCSAHRYWNDKWNEQENHDAFFDDVKLHGHNYTLFITISGDVKHLCFCSAASLIQHVRP